MARTWLSIQVELVGGGHGPDLWPRPGRILLARPGMTFRQLADAINEVFARWDRAHLHAFALADGTRIAFRTRWDEEDDDALDDTREKLSRLSLGERFAFEFDLGDSWMHLCTVAERKVDPTEVYGEVPDRPVAYFGWGELPDQHGRRWLGDDGSTPPPAQPDPPLSDLPDLHDTWGSRAFHVPPPPDDDGTVVTGPWTLDDAGARAAGSGGEEPWTPTDLQELRGAVYQGDTVRVLELVGPRDVLEVAHQAAPALLHAVGVQRDPDAMAVVVELLEPLADRAWLGDDELIDELHSAMLPGDVPDLRDVLVDLDELATHLEGPPDPEGGWSLEVATGRLWPRDPLMLIGEDEPEDFDDPAAFVSVDGLGSSYGYADMRDFIASVEDDALAERLHDAIRGKGAFRRFRDVVHGDTAVLPAWSLFSSERSLGRARWWLAEAGLRPVVPPR